MPTWVNPGPYVVDLPTLMIRLLPGEETEYPEPLAGLLEVKDVSPDDAQPATPLGDDGKHRLIDNDTVIPVKDGPL